MSGRQLERGRGRGRGRGDSTLAYRGRGGSDSQGFRGGRGGQDGGGRGGFGRGRGAPEVEVFSHGGAGTSLKQDMKIQKIEDETQRAGQIKTTPGSKKAADDQRLPLRPGYGTQGRPVLLWANYFQLVTPPNMLLFRYSIEILKDKAGRTPTGRRLQQIVQLLIEEHLTAYQSGIATDNKSNLVSRFELPIDEEPYAIRYRSEKEDEPSQNAQTYQIRLKDTGTLRVSELMDYLTSTNASEFFGSKNEIIQALNIVVGHYPKTAANIFSVGGNKHFDISQAGMESQNLGAGLRAIRGFFISVRAATSRLLVNVQVKYAACYNQGPLAGLIAMYLAEAGPNMVNLGKFLKSLRVQVTHIVRKNKNGHTIPRIKTITSLAMQGDGRDLPHPPVVPYYAAGAKEVKFFLGTAEEQPGQKQQDAAKAGGKKGKKARKAGPQPPEEGYISVYDFFQRNYNVTIRDPSMPVINVGTRQNPSYLPADVCDVLPGQPSGTKLSPAQTQNMIRFAVRKPTANASSVVTKGAQILGIESPTNSMLDGYGITITPKLTVVPGRVLTGPDVKYYGGKAASTRFGSWNMQSIQFSTKATLPSWTYLWLSIEGTKDAWNNTEELIPSLIAFTAKLQEVGIGVKAGTPGLRITLGGPDIDAQIDAAIQRFVSNPKKTPPKLLLVILPKADTAIYNRIKFACDIRAGLRNICVIGSKFGKKPNDQYFANVALKFNLKLGGQNQILDNKKLGIIPEGKTMVVGIDVTHPSPGSASNAPSVAGIVASVDQWLGQWPADLQIQAARQEMVAGLDGMFKSRLRLWAKHNKNALPENILVYRDGVSEGQYDIVLDKELPLFRKACKEVYPATDTNKSLPRISIIIVGKRHHTRFYPTTKEGADRSSNPQNGTIVDRGVTEARNWDFFLQAHTVIQGTARPAHYYIVLDEIFRDGKIRYPFQNAADALEDLTHNMCYLFGRATKAVSICPPAYYADLVCERARCYLSRFFEATPGATPAGSVVEGGSEPEQEGVRVHENVRDTMFYI